ncbi:22919_t:CDS:1, partial [Rhizophagus irregularis]
MSGIPVNMLKHFKLRVSKVSEENTKYFLQIIIKKIKCLHVEIND